MPAIFAWEIVCACVCVCAHKVLISRLHIRMSISQNMIIAANN